MPSATDARVIALVGAAHAVSHFFHLILAPLFPWLREEFALSFAELGLLMSVFFALSAAGQVAAGFLVDRVGALRVLLGGIGLLAAAALVLAAAQDYSVLICGAMLAGLGNSAFHPADLALLNHRVSTSRLGHAFAIHGVAGSIGWAVAPLFLTMACSLWGWRVALSLASLIPLAVFSLLFFNRSVLCGDVRQAEHRPVLRGAMAKAGAPGFVRLHSVWIGFVFFLVNRDGDGGHPELLDPELAACLWHAARLGDDRSHPLRDCLRGGNVVGRIPRHESQAPRSHHRTLSIRDWTSGWRPRRCCSER